MKNKIVWVALAFIAFTSAYGIELRTYQVRCDPDEFNHIIERAWEDIYTALLNLTEMSGIT